MIYAQFYALDTGDIPGTIPPRFGDKRPAPATGDRAVIILDGRGRIDNMHTIAAATARQRGYCGYRIYKGDSFTRSSPLTQYIPI